jgi:hypothetical protein
MRIRMRETEERENRAPCDVAEDGGMSADVVRRTRSISLLRFVKRRST